MKWTIALAIVGVLFGASSAIAQGAVCDKTCLMSTADAYLAALLAHDASKAPMAPNAKFTEQTKVMKVGDEGAVEERDLGIADVQDSGSRSGE